MQRKKKNKKSTSHRECTTSTKRNTDGRLARMILNTLHQIAFEDDKLARARRTVPLPQAVVPGAGVALLTA
jgi:hypothetical protein